MRGSGFRKRFKNLETALPQETKTSHVLHFLLNIELILSPSVSYWKLIREHFVFLCQYKCTVAHQNLGFESKSQLHIWVSPPWSACCWSLWKLLYKLFKLQGAVSWPYCVSSCASILVPVSALPRISDE